ncbi:hypothetical protein SK128_024811 [Halocaridina rubra]|uniref:RNA polymerase I-specific transcription initiation factor RRN3 n=1 Tax=Halocaridina rubra TaxID=373956 RepID=A0AAN8XMV2_HALRR
MLHISIIKDEESALDHFSLSSCQKTKDDLYICPICPLPRFGRRESSSKGLSQVCLIKHLRDHFDSPKSLIVKGYKITACFQPCIQNYDAKKWHYHCPFCPDSYTTKVLIKNHILVCQGYVGSTHKSAENLVMNTSTPVGSQRISLFGSRGLNSSFGGQFTAVSRSKNSSQNESLLGFSPLPLTPASSSVVKTVENFTPEKLEFEALEKEDAKAVIQGYLKTADSSTYENVFKSFSTMEDKAGILLWIKELTNCAANLDRKADKLILAFLKLPLFSCDELGKATSSFIQTLVGYHNYFSYHVLKTLFNHLLPALNEDNDDLLISAGSLSADEESTYNSVLSAILLINSDIPLTQNNLLLLASKSMPYLNQHVHIHAVYARNLLRLAESLPHLRVAVLEVIISNMITIDVHAPRLELLEEECEDDVDSNDEEDMFNMEVDDTGREQTENTPLDSCQVPRAMTHKVGNTLDVLMCIMFQYIHDVCHGIKELSLPVHLKSVPEAQNTKLCHPGSESISKFSVKRPDGGCECGGTQQSVSTLKALYNDMKLIFSNTILRTHASAHVQFLLFYLISMRPGLLPFFLDFLINNKFRDPQVAPCIRKNAMAYVGSLLARGKFVTFLEMHTCLKSICDWCDDYLDNQEKIPERYYEDLSLHWPFYHACQTLFYIFTFRYLEYTANKKALAMARSLNLERFVHSRLNPLNICSPPIVKNFVAVAHHFQIAYCHTVMERNKRLGIPAARTDAYVEVKPAVLESLFPFDPYLLQRSKLYIQNHYREFEGLPEDIADDMMEDTCVSVGTPISPEYNDTAFGVSPGFMRFSEDNNL